MNKNGRLIFKIVTLSLLSAIGVVLMLPMLSIPYPVAPFLKIEFSDFVVLLAFLVFGFKEALIVAIIKTLANLLVQGPVGPYAVGQITALVASLAYVFGYLISKLIFRKENAGSKALRSGFTLLFVVFIMTLSNYLFLTPIFVGKFSFLDMTDGAALGFGGKSYLYAIIALYVPFNLLKGIFVVLLGNFIGEPITKIIKNKYKGNDMSESQGNKE